MPLKPIPLGTSRELLADSLLRLARKLKQGECFPLVDIADELKASHSAINSAAKKLGLVSSQYSPASRRNINVLINPKFAPKS